MLSNTKGSKVSFELKRCFARRLAKAIGSRGPPFWRKSVERRSVSKRPIVELELKSRSNRAREGVTTGLSPSKKPLKQLAYYIAEQSHEKGILKMLTTSTIYLSICSAGNSTRCSNACPILLENILGKLVVNTRQKLYGVDKRPPMDK